jgi:hypothetical protein
MIYSRLLLIIFIAGQMILYGHQHSSNGSRVNAHSSSKQTVTERCEICAAMHLNHSVIDHQVHVAPALTGTPVYIHFAYDFISVALVRSAGRSPPVS